MGKKLKSNVDEIEPSGNDLINEKLQSEEKYQLFQEEYDLLKEMLL